MSSPPPSAPPPSAPRQPGDQAGARIVVVGGGTPSPEELAALAVALQPVAAVTSGPSPRANWGEAALLEGVGFRTFNSHVELDRYHRSIA